MKKLMVLATMLAMVLVAAMPASAQLIVIDDVADLDIELCLAIQAGLVVGVGGDVTQNQVQDACNDIVNNFFGDNGNGNGNGGGGNGGGGNGGGGNGGGGGGAEITQENAQETESADVDQSFNITGGGDNSSQCVAPQGVANTGNTQNQTGVLQYGSESGDFEFDEGGGTITLSPETSTTCEQSVEQAAAASSQ